MANLVNKDTQYDNGDKINLIEIFYIILKHKFKIMFFSFVFVVLTFIHVLSIPNLYKSFVVLSPQNSGENISGGLSSLASFAGVNISTTNSRDPFVLMKTILKDYNFNKYIIEKYNLIAKLENQQNFVFMLGIDSVYNFFNSKNEEEYTNLENKIYNNVNLLRGIMNITIDKKSSIITLSAELNDRVLAKELVDIYLEEIISKIKAQDMKEIDEQIKYYNKVLFSTYDVSLKEELSKSLSGLYQKKVFSQSNDYYFVSKIIDSRVSHIKEKIKPQRSFFLIVSFIISIVLGILFVFFLEFIRSDKKNESENF